APGRTLNVSGNIGSPMPRQIGTEVYDYPVIAGAILKPGSKRSSYPYSYHDPYYDPYYDPFWPHTPFYRGYWW
ncbi:MAG TPA: Slp family lipoprotein, partial [Burkholderiales bacterium]|nr:Slp family lipoprotein [Burkholderiales bacterium]